MTDQKQATISNNADFSDISLLVMSCDKFKPVWPVFFRLFRKYWPEFNGPAYLYSETESCVVDGVHSLHSGMAGAASNWSDGLRFALDRIESDRVFFMLEDFLLNRPVRASEVRKMADLMQAEDDVKCIRTVPIPAGDQPGRNGLMHHAPGKPYRISTQMAFWKKDYLYSVARPGESPWEFELNGSRRSNDIPGIVLTVLPGPPETRVMTHLNGLIRGKLTRQAADFLRSEGIPVPEALPVNTKLEEFYWFRAGDHGRKLIDFVNHRVYPVLGANAL